MSARRRPVALVRGAAGVIGCALLWEVFARSGYFPQALTPTLVEIAGALWRSLADGTMLKHAAYTLGRIALGLSLACAVAIPLGMLMARVRAVERFFMPLISVLMPIPSLAWVPLFILWFGIGDTSTILVVVYAASFPMLYNVWGGVRAVNPLWVRVGKTLGADRRAVFTRIIWPAAIPYVITGLRLSFGRAWIAVVGGELLASPTWGLGKLIFDAKEFLNAEVMLAALVVIAAFGLFFERVVFQRLERRTVVRWGMAAGSDK